MPDTVQNAGSKLSYADAGVRGVWRNSCYRCRTERSPPLVLLHGTSSNSAAWFGYIRSWAEDFRIYSVDLPGRPGLSDEWRPNVGDGSMSRWLRSTIECPGITAFHICGMSLGSTVAPGYRMSYPESILSMSLLSSRGLAPPKAEFLIRALPLLFLGDLGARRINHTVHVKVPMDPDAQALAGPTGRHFRPFTEKIPLFTDDFLEDINFPLLYIGGSEDVLLNTPRSAERLKRLVSSAEIQVLENVGHIILDQGNTVAGRPDSRRTDQPRTNSQSIAASAAGPASDRNSTEPGPKLTSATLSKPSGMRQTP